MKPLFNIGIPLILMIAFLFVVQFAWGMQDRADCLMWQSEAASIPTVYFITPAQKAQCDYWHIDLGNTQVK